MKVMMREFMSSEENGDEMIVRKRLAVIKVKLLPWRFSCIGRPHVIGNRYLRQQLVGFALDFFGFEQD